MEKSFVTAFLCLFYASSFSQDVKNYVAENTVKIIHIDPQSNDYSDLELIGEAIGEAKIVMLGEQDHGDAPTFLAKTRLVKYLHEKKGFNVLAFESDFYGLTKGWDEVSKQPDSIKLFLNKNVFPHWTRSDACRYLFQEYIPNSFQTEAPLQISGFDSQLFLDYSFVNLKNDLDEYLTNNILVSKIFTDTEHQTFLNAVEGLIAKIRRADAFDSNMSKALKDGLEKIEKVQLENMDTSYWSVVIHNLIAFNENSNEIRDNAMSHNLKYLVNNKYKAEKIIVWAANGHIMKYADQIKSKRRNLDTVIFDNMGTEFTKDSLWASNTYVLGFTSYKGTAGRLWTEPFPIQDPDENGLEIWIPENISFGFLDFNDYNQRFSNPTAPFLMKGPVHFTIPKRFIKIPWNLVYDGIFFIRDMYPVKMIEQ